MLPSTLSWVCSRNRTVRRVVDVKSPPAPSKPRQSRTGETSEQDYEGTLAVCIQHEMDHLEGKLFVDYLSDLKRERIRKKLAKERKERASKPSAAAGQARRAY